MQSIRLIFLYFILLLPTELSAHFPDIAEAQVILRAHQFIDIGASIVHQQWPVTDGTQKVKLKKYFDSLFTSTEDTLKAGSNSVLIVIDDNKHGIAHGLANGLNVTGIKKCSSTFSLFNGWVNLPVSKGANSYQLETPLTPACDRLLFSDSNDFSFNNIPGSYYSAIKNLTLYEMLIDTNRDTDEPVLSPVSGDAIEHPAGKLLSGGGGGGSSDDHDLFKPFKPGGGFKPESLYAFALMPVWNPVSSFMETLSRKGSPRSLRLTLSPSSEYVNVLAFDDNGQSRLLQVTTEYIRSLMNMDDSETLELHNLPTEIQLLSGKDFSEISLQMAALSIGNALAALNVPESSSEVPVYLLAGGKKSGGANGGKNDEPAKHKKFRALFGNKSNKAGKESNDDRSNGGGEQNHIFCTICQEGFDSHDELQTHIDTCHNPQDYQRPKITIEMMGQKVAETIDTLTSQGRFQWTWIYPYLANKVNPSRLPAFANKFVEIVGKHNLPNENIIEFLDSDAMGATVNTSRETNRIYIIHSLMVLADSKDEQKRAAGKRSSERSMNWQQQVMTYQVCSQPVAW